MSICLYILRYVIGMSIHIYIYIYTYIYVCVYVYLYIAISVYMRDMGIDIDTDIESDIDRIIHIDAWTRHLFKSEALQYSVYWSLGRWALISLPLRKQLYVI